jgi:hypothetical protein
MTRLAWLMLYALERETLAFAFVATDVAANLGCLAALALMGDRLTGPAAYGAVLALVGIALMAGGGR